MLILLAVGALIGAWMLSGTVPTLIHYGLKVLNPSLFYAASCLICALVATAIGSSWTTAGTLGVALIGIALAQGLSPEITAGAIISAIPPVRMTGLPVSTLNRDSTCPA